MKRVRTDGAGDGPAAARRILVVDDEQDVLRLVEQVLRAARYDVRATTNPQEALELARAKPFDLVVSDIAMPVMDGYGLLRALQQGHETATLPVLFLTARREFSERVRAFRFGAVDFITKPFTQRGFLERVERALRQKHNAPGRVVGSGPGAAEALLLEAQRESRSGVLTAGLPGREVRVMLRAGEVVHATGPLPADGAAEFEELDARREQILTGEAPPADAGAPVEFDDVPAALRTVLVAEDDELFRRFLRGLLVSRDFSVHEAGDGEGALQVALEKRPWLILADVVMPGLDGLEFCRRVRQHSLIRHTPLVLISGWDDYKERYRGLAAGADEFLSKSSPVRELLIRVQLVLRRYVDLGRREEGRALAGELEVVGAPGLLQICHLSRLSGHLDVRGRDGTQSFRATFRQGEILAARTGDHGDVEAVFAFLAWSEGHFAFTPGQPSAADPALGPFEQILLEGCRRLDEGRNGV